jgi:hypothetical protein
MLDIHRKDVKMDLLAEELTSKTSLAYVYQHYHQDLWQKRRGEMKEPCVTPNSILKKLLVTVSRLVVSSSAIDIQDRT